MLDALGFGLYRLDAEGRCTYANPAALQMLGYAADELVGRSLAELVAQQDSYPDGCSAMEAIGHGTREVLIRHRDGGLRGVVRDAVTAAEDLVDDAATGTVI